jgi:LysR family transcriptional activator of nhaA
VQQLNYKHLRYFWMVAKAGSIARASEQLHLTPQSISGQLTTLEAALGVALFERQGRQLQLTEVGRQVLGYADEIFRLGAALSETLRQGPSQKAMVFRVGIADVVPKSVAFRLIEPALHLAEPVQLVCREGRLAMLLAELALQKLDLVIADRASPPSVSVRCYSHFLGESSVSAFAKPRLAAQLKPGFPDSLDGAPLLLPSSDVAMRARLMQWLDEHSLRPRIVGEFDDSALMKAFGQAGAGVFVAATAIAADVCRQYGVRQLGTMETVREQLYAITPQRRLLHPAVVAVSEAARQELFSWSAGT